MVFTSFSSLYHKNIKNLDILSKILEKIIEGLVNESTMDDKTFKRLVNKKFEEEYSKKQNREKNILAIFNKKRSIATEQLCFPKRKEVIKMINELQPASKPVTHRTLYYTIVFSKFIGLMIFVLKY